MSFTPFNPFRGFGGGGAVLSLDPDAAAYIAALETAGATVSPTQSAAIDAFIVAEKAGSRWDLIKRLYLPIWALEAPNAICMRRLASGSFVGGAGVTHGAGYIKSNGSTGYFNMAGTMSGDGLTTSNGMMFVARKAVPAGTVKGTMGNTSPGRVIILPQPTNKIRSDWGDTSNIFVTTAHNDDIGGVFVSTRNTVGIRHTIRTASGRLSDSVTRAASGSMLSGTSRLMVIASFWDTSHHLCFGWGLALSDADDSAFTANLKTLWETCTGLTLP